MASTLQGIDVSNHNGDVDFAKTHGAGYRFVIVKCTEGQGFTDPRFTSNWSRLRGLEGTVGRGAYHFGRHDSIGGKGDGETEAADFCRVLKAVGGYGAGALPPIIDFEKYSENGPSQNVPWIEGFVHVVEQELGRSPMIYTGRNVWKYENGNTAAFVHLPLWQVYYAAPTVDAPVTGLPWKKWTMWQWSGGGSAVYGPKVAGVPPDPGVVDLNRLNGGEKTLQRLLEPAIWTPENPWDPTDHETIQMPPPGIMPLLDLAAVGDTDFHPVAAQVQGLLLARGYGPDGLVSDSGLPDGQPGPKTLAALKEFKSTRGLPRDGVIDGATWWSLLSTGM